MQDPTEQLCRHCEYDLIGLPDSGVCPECGQTYDKQSQVGMRHGLDDQYAFDRKMRKARTILFLVLTLISVLFTCFFSYASKAPAKPLAIGFILTIILLLCTALSYKSENL